ncbi:MAG: YjfI family protein [Pseudomonadota bacterium]
MSEKVDFWSTKSLYEALSDHEMTTTGRARIELIDGVDASLHIVMTEYGDLPIFLTVSGEQIIAESVLWPASDVVDVAAFNDAVLRTHKYFPLSTISLDRISDDDEVYQMFGALSAASKLQNVVLEIEVLASNVLQATQAYMEFLDVTAEAV